MKRIFPLKIVMSLLFLIALSASPVFAVTYGYDELGRLTSVTYDSGQKTVYTYDPAGNMLSAQTQNQPPTITPETVNNIMGHSITLTFPDDPTWRNAITGITVDGATLDGSKFGISAGTITIDQSVFRAAGDYSIAVQAVNYDDAAVTQTIVQPVYTLTPAVNAAYTIGATSAGIPTMTVNAGMGGFRNFSANITPVLQHNGNETTVFALSRNGIQIGLNATSADFDTIQTAQAGFNVLPNDIVKNFIVDELTNATDRNPIIFMDPLTESGMSSPSASHPNINSDTADLCDVETSLSLSIESASIGQTVTASGTSSPNNWVPIKILDQNESILLFDTALSDAEGNFSMDFTLPDSAFGQLTIIAGSGGDIATQTLEVVEDIEDPTWDDDTLTSSNITAAGLTLNWNPAADNVGIKNYRVYKNNRSLATVSGSTQTYNVTGLTANTTYSFYIRAYDYAGNNITGQSISITTSQN